MSLRRLREGGLKMVYMGLDSGCDAVLERMQKGHTAAAIVAAGQKARRAALAARTAGRRVAAMALELVTAGESHGREAVAVQAEEIAQMLGSACRSHDILYSSAILKKTGLRLKD